MAHLTWRITNCLDVTSFEPFPMNDMPTVALYFPRLGGLGGGAERMICALSCALAKRGFAVHLMSWDDDSTDIFYPLDRRVERHALGHPPGLKGKFTRTWRLAEILRRNTVSVLVGFVMSGDKTVYAAAKLAGVKIIAAERNSPAMYRLRYDSVQRISNLASLHLCDRIVVQFKEYIRGYPASLRQRISVIANPVGAALKHARPAEPAANGRYTLLSAGRLDSLQKRIDHVVSAFAKIANDHPNWDLRLVGDGPQEPQLRSMIRELGLSDRVRLEPTTPDIFSAYASAHLFVIPSLWEGFPNGLAEAMSHGLPAVGYRGADGVAQLIEDGVTGWLATGVDDPQSLASSLSAAMAGAEERKRRGEEARFAMNAYEPEAQYDRWAELIMSCARGAGL